jgi:hypothetical protein
MRLIVGGGCGFAGERRAWPAQNQIRRHHHDTGYVAYARYSIFYQLKSKHFVIGCMVRKRYTIMLSLSNSAVA